MKKSNIAFISIAVVVVIAIALIFTVLKPHTNGQAINSNSQSSGKELFSQSSFYQYAYQIFPGVLSPDARKAITGFNLDIGNNPDGSTNITLNATNPEYQSQTYTVEPGEKLYFIEKTIMDDSSNEDHFLGDDMAVVVNSQGYIVQGPGSA